MALKMQVTEALKPVDGTFHLIFGRWLIAILAALPGIVVGGNELSELMGRNSFFSSAPDPLPIVQMAAFVTHIPGSVLGLLAFGLVFSIIANFLLTAAAAKILEPGRTGKPRVWRNMVEVGSLYFWQYLRIAILAIVLLAVGASLIGKLYKLLQDYAEVMRWSGYSRFIIMPLIRVAMVLMWASAVGVFCWWLRVITVADGRRFLRRILPLVFRIWRRQFFQGFLIHWLLIMSSLLISALVLYGWRQSDSAEWGWYVLWLSILLIQVGIWHWRIRIYRLLWAGDKLQDLGTRPDQPWHIWRLMYQYISRKLKRA